MSLGEIPMLLVLAGLAAYVVLGGADFGAGLWYMLLGRRGRERERGHTYHAMGPVWEANHVWLIFVLVVAWTAYPEAFGSIASTLYVPLFLAAIGIILRGTTYALRGAASETRVERLVGVIFGLSSVITPFALGAAIGGIASGRVPVGNAAGDPFESWLGATSILIGLLSVATSAYLAAVWLTADAARAGDAGLVGTFRQLAMGSGVVAGGLAVAGLLVLRGDSREVFDGLTSGAGLAAVIVSGLAGAATLAWVVYGRFELARYGAAVAVAAIVAGWAIAQSPNLLPGLTVEEAAAGDATVIALLVSIALGAVVLIPSLFLLFSLVLGGRFDVRPEEPGSLDEAGRGDDATRSPTPAPEVASAPPTDRTPLLGRLAAAAFALGVPLTAIPDGGPVLALGVVLLLTGTALGAAVLVPRAIDA